MFLRFKNVKDFDGISKRIGKKSENLIIMQQWGFPVPDGGCITTEGFDLFLKQNKIDHLVEELRLDQLQSRHE